MLTQITLKNFVIVEKLELDFDNHLNVLTGETGAGKSIWVDAIGYALGNRADPSVIRTGADRCDITVCFDINHNASAKQWLTQNDMDDDDECIIRRIIKANGSRITINGTPTTLQMARELSALLIQIHSQHQHQELLKAEKQRDLIDDFAQTSPLRTEIATLYFDYQAHEKQRAELLAEASGRDSEMELLTYQLDELTELNLQENEWGTLSTQHQQLHNAKQFMQQLNQAIELTTEHEETAASTLVRQALDHLNHNLTDDPHIQSVKAMLNTALINLEEAGNELSTYRSQLDLSPETLQEIETRLTRIHDLARKHHVAPKELQAAQASLEEKLNRLKNSDVLQEALEKKQKKILSRYQTLANQLSTVRNKAAKSIDTAIKPLLKKLGMEQATFHTQLEKQDRVISPTGAENTTFYISTNKGQTPQPLMKVVSGGELSRISLALHVITAKTTQPPSMIFDEVDVGISGRTAAIVGELLRQLGESTQILCITHLAQVAAQGHHHYKVSKTASGQHTKTHIQRLSREERVTEIARILGGATITKNAVEHAEELLA